MACCHTSSVGVCTLLALSGGWDKDGLGSLAGLKVLDPCACIGLGAALGLDSRLSQDSPSVLLVFLDIPGRGTFGTVGVDHHAGFLGHAVFDPLAQHVSVDHNDLFESLDTFSDQHVFLDQTLAASLLVERPFVLKDLALTDLGVEVLYSLLTDHIVLSWLDHSVDPSFLAFLVFFVHIQVEEVPCSDLVPSVFDQVCSVAVHPLVSCLAPDLKA